MCIRDRVKELPELNDDLAKDTSEFDTLEELKADIKGKLEHERTHAAEDAVENQLLDQLLEGFKAEVPDAMYNHRVDESVRDFDYRLQSQGLNLQTYMQYTGCLLYTSTAADDPMKVLEIDHIQGAYEAGDLQHAF